MAKTAQEKLDEKREKEYKKKHKKIYKTKPGDIVFNILNYVFFILFTLTCIFPFYYLFINTISDNDLVKRGLINFYPKGLNINNYIALKGVNDLGYAFLVTISRTILATILMVVASAFVGYLVTKQEMWKRSFWYRFLVITMYFNAGLIPWYLNFAMLGLTNKYSAYILPAIVAPYNIILVKLCCNVNNCELFCINIRESWKEFQLPTAPNIAIVARIGLLRGNISFLNTVMCDAPSINALSSSSAGIDSMYVFTSIML